MFAGLCQTSSPSFPNTSPSGKDEKPLKEIVPFTLINQAHSWYPLKKTSSNASAAAKKAARQNSGCGLKISLNKRASGTDIVFWVFV